jgi:hypothetical protein
MNTHLIKATPQLPYVSATDETGEAIKAAIRGLEGDTGFLTKFRLQRSKGKEALALAEVALAEYMAAKRRAFVYQVTLTEDKVKKTLLKNSMADTAVIENEIATVIAGAVTAFEDLIHTQEEATYQVEMEHIAAAKALFDAGKISEARYHRLVANIEESTDKIVATVQSVTRQILANLEHRFHAALSQS